MLAVAQGASVAPSGSEWPPAAPALQQQKFVWWQSPKRCNCTPHSVKKKKKVEEKHRERQNKTVGRLNKQRNCCRNWIFYPWFKTSKVLLYANKKLGAYFSKPLYWRTFLWATPATALPVSVHSTVQNPLFLEGLKCSMHIIWNAFLHSPEYLYVV